MGEQTGGKVLRIGVIQGGKILEERLLRRRAPVTVGSDPKNTFALAGDPGKSPQGDELPHSFKLLDVVVDRYVLCFDDEMRGSLTVEGEKLDLEGIKAKGLALQSGSVYRVELAEGARGKISIGELTFLFQFVVPPPQHERSQLPVLARGSWSTAFDGALGLCLLVSLAAHGALLANLRTVERPPAPLPLERPTPVARFVASAPAAAPGDRAARRGILRIIGARGPAASNGAVVDLLASGSSSGDLDGVLQHLAGIGPTAGRQIGSAPASTPAAQETRGQFLSAASAPAAVAGTVSAEPAEVIDGALDPAAVATAMRSRLGGVRWCYSEALARSPQLRGRIVISIVIDGDGRVTSSKVDTNTLGDDVAARCIEAVLKRARLPVAGPGSAQVLLPYGFAP